MELNVHVLMDVYHKTNMVSQYTFNDASCYQHHALSTFQSSFTTNKTSSYKCALPCQ